MAKRKAVDGGRLDQMFACLSLKYRRMAVYRCIQDGDQLARFVNVNDAADSRIMPVRAIGGSIRPAEQRADGWYVESWGVWIKTEVRSVG